MICLTCSNYSQSKIKQGVEYDDNRGPTKLLYGPKGKLKHSYTRAALPNLSLRSAQYRCKSDHTYQCMARLKIEEVNGRDHYMINGHHSDMCKVNNGIKPKHAHGLNEDHDVKIEDMCGQYKKRCTDLALEKIWLQPLKIWEMVRDEMLAKLPHGVVVPLVGQVSIHFLFAMCNLMFHM